MSKNPGWPVFPNYLEIPGIPESHKKYLLLSALALKDSKCWKRTAAVA